MDKRSIPQKYQFFPLDVLNIQTARGVNNGHMLIHGFYCYKLTRKCCKKGYWTFYCDSPNCNKKMYLLFGTMKAGEGPESHTCVTKLGDIGGYPRFGRCHQFPQQARPVISLPVDIPPFPGFSIDSVQSVYIDLDKHLKAESYQLGKPTQDRSVLCRHHISLPYRYRPGSRGMNIKVFLRMKGPQNRIYKIFHEIKHRFPVVRGTIVQVDSANRRIYFSVLSGSFPSSAPDINVELTIPAMKIVKQRQTLQTFGVAMLDGKLAYCAQFPPIPNLGGRALEVLVNIRGLIKGNEGFHFICEGKFRTVARTLRKTLPPQRGMPLPHHQKGRNSSGMHPRVRNDFDVPPPPPAPSRGMNMRTPSIKKGGMSDTSLTGFSIGSDVGLSIDNNTLDTGGNIILSGGEEFGNSSGGEGGGGIGGGSFYGGSSLEGGDSYPSSEEENMFVKEMFGLTDKTDDVLF